MTRIARSLVKLAPALLLALASACPVHAVEKRAEDAETMEELLGNAHDGRLKLSSMTDDPVTTGRRIIRVLVSYSDTNYFVAKGKQRGLEYELMILLEKHLNEGKVPADRRRHIVFITVPFDQLLPSLIEGRGDIAAGGLTITPAREKRVAFTRPYLSDVREIVVRSKDAPQPGSLRELAGRRIHVLAGSSFLAHLQALNRRLVQEGLKPIVILEVDPNLEVEDLLQMVNAGIFQYTVADSHVAEIWKRVLTDMEPMPELALNEGGRIAWAVRRGNPDLLRTLNGFIARHREGTLLGNILFKRYFQNAQWIKNPSDTITRSRIAELQPLFSKYGKKYNIDWRLLAALAYQESGFNQKKRSRAGAVGIMQIKPSTAAGKPIRIKGVRKSADRNVHAAAKYLDYLRQRYFSDDAIRPATQIDFTLAAYNAGPARVMALRKKTAAAGLDPNEWFFNVEHIARKEIGRETVNYVANIFKYYIAFASIEDTLRERARVESGLKPPPAGTGKN